MKDVVLFTQASSAALPVLAGSFESLREAQIHAEASSKPGASFFIYRLRTQGQFSTVNWTDKHVAPDKARPWSAAEIDTLFRARAEGISIADIATSLGRSYAACSIYYTTHSKSGELLPATKARWTKDDVDYLFQARDKDTSFEEIAEVLKRTPSACKMYH